MRPHRFEKSYFIAGIRLSWLILIFIVLVSCGASHECKSRSELQEPDGIRGRSTTPEPELKSQMPNFSVAGITEEEAEAFFVTLKQAVMDDHKSKVASLVSYPIRVQVGGYPKAISNPDEFISHYSEILTDKVKQAVLRQEFREVFVNWQGVRIGRGEIWFAGISQESTYQVRIIAINN